MAFKAFKEESMGNEEGGITGTKLLFSRAPVGRESVSRVVSPLRIEAPAPFRSSWGALDKVTIVAVITFPVVSSIKGRVEVATAESVEANDPSAAGLPSL
jgi:hypothetical protein